MEGKRVLDHATSAQRSACFDKANRERIYPSGEFSSIRELYTTRSGPCVVVLLTDGLEEKRVAADMYMRLGGFPIAGFDLTAFAVEGSALVELAKNARAILTSRVTRRAGS